METRKRLPVAANLHKLLKRCKTLTDAEQQLSVVRPPMNKATIWGIWDGFRGLPATDSGLKGKEKIDYTDGYDEGKDAR